MSDFNAIAEGDYHAVDRDRVRTTAAERLPLALFDRELCWLLLDRNQLGDGVFAFVALDVWPDLRCYLEMNNADFLAIIDPDVLGVVVYADQSFSVRFCVTGRPPQQFKLLALAIMADTMQSTIPLARCEISEGWSRFALARGDDALDREPTR